MHSALLKVAVCIALGMVLSCSQPAPQSYRLFGVSDMFRVFEDGYNLPVTHDTINLFGIRGEVISAHVNDLKSKATIKED